MGKAAPKLEELFRNCIVRINAGKKTGTGFFVAPGLVLTCAHVIEDNQGNLLESGDIEINLQQAHNPEIVSFLPSPYPDLAVLRVPHQNHGCVYLHEVLELGDKCYSFGFTKAYPDGDSALFTYEGPSGGKAPLLKLKDAQAEQGLSGAPLLNIRTGVVTGVLKKSRNIHSNQGGRAIPIETLINKLPYLLDNQINYHSQNGYWLSNVSEQQRKIIGWGGFEVAQIPISELEIPAGAVKDKRLYIKRRVDEAFRVMLLKPGSVISIIAPGQTGKSSLLAQAIRHARENNCNVVHLEVTIFNSEDWDSFFKFMAYYIVKKLGLDTEKINDHWDMNLGSMASLSIVMEEYVLPNISSTLVIAIDEANILLNTPISKQFGELLKIWHDKSATSELWEKAVIVVVFSTEVFLLSSNAMDFPHNTGYDLSLEFFNNSQVERLNGLHGNPIDTSDLDDFMDFLGGHPFLVRKALYEIAVNDFSWHDLKTGALQFESPFNLHLYNYAKIIDRRNDLKNVLTNLLNSQPIDMQSAEPLEKAGVLVKQNGSFKFSCELYKISFTRLINQ